MKITVEFNSFDELKGFCMNMQAKAPEKKLKEAIASEEPTALEEKPKKVEAPKEKPKKAETPEEESTDGLKVEVRKLLAQVNKKSDTNMASQLIKELTSANKLTDVEDIDELKALKAKAEEVLNG